MTDHPPTTIVRHAALALRDLAEQLGADVASVTIDGLVVTYSTDDGIHLLAPEGEPLDITDWADRIALGPLSGSAPDNAKPVVGKMGSATDCTHERVVKPLRPIPDWTSPPCPDCGERCKHDGKGGLRTVRENNALAEARRPAARIAALEALLREARDVLGVSHLVEDTEEWDREKEAWREIDSPTCPVCAMEAKIDDALGTKQPGEVES